MATSVQSPTTVSRSSPKKEILIIPKIAGAINKFMPGAINPNHVGKTIYIGAEGDGGFGIEVASNYQEGGESHRRLFERDGTIKDFCFIQRTRNHYLAAARALDSCDNTTKLVLRVSPQDMRILVGALFGWKEVGKEPSTPERILAEGLHRAIGLENK